MTGLLRGYVRVIDAINRRVGRLVMYGVFVLAGILLWSSISKVVSNQPFNWIDAPSIWTLEMAQFAMVAYYILGGPYSIQLGSNVRMDLFYADWTPRRKAWFDAFSVLCLIFFLGVLLYGGIDSTAYSLGHFKGEPVAYFGDLTHAFVTGGPDAAGEMIGTLERSRTAWRPFLWPIKVLMCLGIFLMLLQAISELCKDILTLLGREAR